MKDKHGNNILIGDLVKTIDTLSIGRVVEIDEQADSITTEYQDGSTLKSSNGIAQFGYAVVVG